MDSTQKTEKQKDKSKNWLFLLIGVLVGFVLSLSLYLIDKHFFPEHVRLVKMIERAVPGVDAEESEGVAVKSVLVEAQNRKAPSAADTLRGDTLLLGDSYDSDLDDVDFMMDDYEAEFVSEDKIVANRRVKVRFAEADTLKPAQTEYFLVEQWNSPIKNRITYYRDNLMLKIKGMDVSKIEIYYIKGEYYLLNGNRYYQLNNTTSFEKLTEASVVPM
jgi:hypothetical protein